MSIFDKFLKDTESVGVPGGGSLPLVSSPNPVEWGRLGQAIVVALVSAVTLGWQLIIDAVVTGYTSLITGVTTFLAGTDPFFLGGSTSGDGGFITGLREIENTGLIGTTLGQLTEIVDTAWSQLGTVEPAWLQYPIAVVTTLVTLYVVNWGYRTLRREVFV